MAVNILQNISRFCTVHRWNLVLFVFLFGSVATYAQTPQPTPTVAPNPTADQVTIELQVEQEATASVSILDITGKVVAAKARTFDKGSNKFQFLLDGMVDGLYFVQVQQGGLTSTRKLVIQR